MITVTLPFPTPSLNSRSGRNWRAQWASRRRFQHQVAQEIAVQRIQAGAAWAKPLARARIRITRHGVGQLDPDNLVGGCKPVIDVLKPMHPDTNPRGLGLIAGDEAHRLDLVVQQVRCARGAEKTVIEITPLEEPA